MVDLHSHVMYGWDDGAETLETSLEMVRVAAADGIRVLAATPHMWWKDECVDPGMVRERVAEINEAALHQGLQVRIVTGTEVPAYWDHLDYIRGKRVLSLNDSRTVLFEVPFHHLPVQMNDLIFQLKMLGYMPLMAHPERCAAFQADPDYFRRMISEDTPVQVNAGSLMGFFGESIRELAWEIVAQERPVVIASDAHNAGSRGPVLSEARAALAAEFGEAAAELMCSGNAAALIENRPARIADLRRRPERALLRK